MIEYIKGEIADLTPTSVVLETSGVGFLLSISLNTYTALQRESSARLYVYEAIREDAYQLYGFFDKTERNIFVLLINVSGIGGATARMVLSAFSPSDLAHIVQLEDVRALKSVKGVGPKAAQRIIVDLKDKMAEFLVLGGMGKKESSAVITPIAEEAVQALTTLGFPPVSAQKIVLQILEGEPELSVESVIKKALKLL